MTQTVVDGGLDIVTNRIKGSGTEPLNIGWGTGAGALSTSSTGLSTEKDVDLSATSGNRTAGTSSRQTTSTTNDTYRVTGTRTATGGGTVTNAGLFDNATIASGNFFGGADGLSITLANGDAIAFTINTVFNQA